METLITEPTKPILSHLLPLAQRAYNWTSHNPESRGQRVVDDYSAELTADIEAIKAAAAKNTDIDFLLTPIGVV